MKITFMPMNQTVELKEEETILQAARRAGIFIEIACAACGSCGKCKVFVMKGDAGKITTVELKKLKGDEIRQGIRLACQARPREDIVVMVQQRKTMAEAKEEVVNKYSDHSDELGVAMDIGTTTVEIRIYDLKKKICLNKQTMMNPQRAYGTDVISRITFCMESEENQKQLQKCLVEQCNAKIREMLHSIGKNEMQICRYVAAGNTTMGHILAGMAVDGLGRAPIKPACYSYETIDCKKIGLIGGASSSLYLFPNVGGHVGGDTTAGLLSSAFGSKPGCFLLVDVGTNGEIALCKDGQVFACSTAAGPAFEGASLSHGMCANQGAIAHVVIYHGKPVLEVLGGVEPIGITGSGIVDAVAELLRADMIDYTGLLREEYREEGYCLNEQQQIRISQDDIRQIQLAKGAIAAGISLMLKRAGITKGELDGCYLAGTFGGHLNVRNAMRIGLIPTLPLHKVEYLGNISCAGASKMLLGEWTKEEVNQFASSVIHLELAQNDRFQDTFMRKLNF